MDILSLLRGTTVLSHTGSFPLLVVTKCEVLLPLLLILKSPSWRAGAFSWRKNSREMAPVAVPGAGYQALTAGLCPCYISASLHINQKSTSDVFLVPFLISLRVCSVRAVRTWNSSYVYLLGKNCGKGVWGWCPRAVLWVTAPPLPSWRFGSGSASLLLPGSHSLQSPCWGRQKNHLNS